MDSIRVDEQGGMVGEGNGSKNAWRSRRQYWKSAAYRGTSFIGRETLGWMATVEAETGDAGDSPCHGRTTRG